MFTTTVSNDGDQDHRDDGNDAGDILPLDADIARQVSERQAKSSQHVGNPTNQQERSGQGR